MNTEFATTTISIDPHQFNALNTSLQAIASATQHQPFWDTQIFAAIIGALLGLVPALYLLLKDRPIIEVKISASLVSLPPDRMRTGFSIAIYNHGRRPVNIERVYLRFETGESLVFLNESNFVGASGLPKVLGEGNSHSVTILAQTIAQTILERDSEYPVCACYSDALGKVYKVKTSKKFWEDIFTASAND